MVVGLGEELVGEEAVAAGVTGVVEEEVEVVVWGRVSLLAVAAVVCLMAVACSGNYSYRAAPLDSQGVVPIAAHPCGFCRRVAQFR